jgi:hypothetical protein
MKDNVKMSINIEVQCQVLYITSEQRVVEMNGHWRPTSEIILWRGNLTQSTRTALYPVTPPIVHPKRRRGIFGDLQSGESPVLGLNHP